MKTDVVKKPKGSGSALRKRSESMSRIDARISRKLKDKIEQAAHIKGLTKTDFLAVALDEVASRIIMEETTLQLHIDDQRKLADVLLGGKPFPAAAKMSRLRRYAAEYDKRVARK